MLITRPIRAGMIIPLPSPYSTRDASSPAAHPDSPPA
jgi:hypothetical protein